MLTRYKNSIIFAFIGVALGIIAGCYSFISTANIESFYSDYGATIETYTNLFASFDASIDYGFVADVLYISLLVLDAISMVLLLPCLMLAIFNIKECELNIDEFKANKKLHIWYIICIAIALVNVWNISGSDILVIACQMLSALFLILSLSHVISTLRMVRHFGNISSNDTNVKVNKINDDVIDATYSVSENKEDENINDDNIEIKEEIKEEPKEKVDLSEIYELLAKLERSHNNHEISDDDYERMKNTILERIK